jgi:DNA-binding response OmpR family regulator
MTSSDPIYLMVAEDDDAIRTGLVDLLQSEGYRVKAALNGREALDFYKAERFDLILLDVMMPEINGFDVCQKIRAMDTAVPVIMLTAKSEEIDKVVGLKLGADDYITKPFGVHELLARIDAVLRRAKLTKKHPGKIAADHRVFSFGGATIDVQKYEGCQNKAAFALSSRELALIKYFHSHPDMVLSRDQILNAVWGIGYFGTTRTLDQHVAKLRKKIEPDAAHPCYLLTVHGVGYRYAPAINQTKGIK